MGDMITHCHWIRQFMADNDEPSVNICVVMCVALCCLDDMWPLVRSPFFVCEVYVFNVRVRESLEFAANFGPAVIVILLPIVLRGRISKD